MPTTSKNPSKNSAQRDPPGTPAERPLAGAAALLADWNASLTDFYFRRCQKYWLYPLELSDVRSLEDVAQSLVEFETELVADYADQADEFLRIAGSEHRKAPDASVRHYEGQILKAQADAAAIIEQAKAQAEHILDAARARAEELAAESAGQDAGESAEPRKSAMG